MNTLKATSTTMMRPDTSSYTQLRGYWLWVGRSLWVAIVLLVVVVQITAATVQFNALRTPCDQQPCLARDQLTSEVADALQEQYGISLNFYAWNSRITETVFIILSWGIPLLIFWRRSDDWMALLVSLVLLTVYSVISPSPETLANAQPLWRWPLELLRVIGFITAISLFYMFPNGRFVPRWTRWLAVILVVLISLMALTGLLFQARVFTFIVAITIGIGAQAYRYRQVSSPLERQQTKWVVLGITGLAVVMIIAVLPTFLVPSLNTRTSRLTPQSVVYLIFVVVPLLQIALTFLPVTLAISMLRYRLWDIDLIIRRTLIYGVLSLLLVLFYFGSVVLLQQAFHALTGQDSPVAIVISTLVIAALFNPLRGRVQGAIDRRFYRSKFDAQQTLAAFAATARDEVELDQLSEELLSVVQETMQPEQTSLWLIGTPTATDTKLKEINRSLI